MKKKTGKTANTDDDVKRDNEEQSQRFIEAAEKAGASASDKKFGELMKTTVEKKIK